MKKIRKLQFDPKKLLKNEELLTLKGGLGLCTYECSCTWYPNSPFISPFSFVCSQGNCAQDIVEELALRCSGGQGTCDLAGCYYGS